MRPGNPGGTRLVSKNSWLLYACSGCFFFLEKLKSSRNIKKLDYVSSSGNSAVRYAFSQLFLMEEETLSAFSDFLHFMIVGLTVDDWRLRRFPNHILPYGRLELMPLVSAPILRVELQRQNKLWRTVQRTGLFQPMWLKSIIARWRDSGFTTSWGVGGRHIFSDST